MTDETEKEPLPWATPRMELIGTIDDVHAGGKRGEPDNDLMSNTIIS